jgi:hypothetical protein
MQKIADRAKKLQKGTWLLTLTSKLPTADPTKTPIKKDRDWEIIASVKLPMSWGLATVHIHKKVQ